MSKINIDTDSRSGSHVNRRWAHPTACKHAEGGAESTRSTKQEEVDTGYALAGLARKGHVVSPRVEHLGEASDPRTCIHVLISNYYYYYYCYCYCYYT